MHLVNADLVRVFIHVVLDSAINEVFDWLWVTAENSEVNCSVVRGHSVPASD